MTQKRYFYKKAVKTHKPLQEGDTVRYLDHNKQWAKGVIQRKNTPGPRDYTILNQGQNQIRRNRIHIVPQKHRIQQNKNDSMSEGASASAHAPDNNKHASQQSHAHYVTRSGWVSKPVVKFGLIQDQQTNTMTKSIHT